jgi:hypothetical protein
MNKKRALVSLLDLLKTNPLVVYQLVVLARFPSLTSAGMFFISLAASHLFLNILLMMNHTSSRLKVIYGCLHKLKGSSFQTFTVKEFFNDDEETYKDIDKWFVKSWFRFYRIRDISLNHLVRIHVVQSPVCVTNLASYPLALFESHIFLHDGPEDTTGVRRFYLLHEIGHTQLKILTSDFSLLAGIKHYLFYLCWVGTTVAWSGDVFIVLLAVVLATVSLSQERRRRLEMVKLVDEIMADGFALAYLSKENLALLEKNKYFPDILYDSHMSPFFNTIRLAKLRENLSLVINGRVDDLIEQAFEMLPLPRLVTLAVLVLLTAIPGLYAAAPTPRTLLRFLAFDATLLLAFLVAFFVSNVMSAVINSTLSASAAPSQ